MDNVIKWLVAVGGSSVTYLFGGLTMLLEVLVAVVVIDVASGMLAAGYEGKLKSAIGYKRIPKKVFIFLMVAAGHFIDQAIGENHFFRDATIYFYLANEVLSIIENAGRVGLPVPNILKQAVEVLKGKSDTKGGGKGV